ncbi:MAG: hypothetical protein ACRDPD_12965 [Streptosporangiaceae bacterium]
MTYANLTQQQESFTGLRALADFLAGHSEVPVPPSTSVLVFLPFASDSAKRREIGVIAAHISSDAETFSSYRRYVPAPQGRSS